jgi:hypothetical protein
MLIVDDILLAPLRGVLWVAGKIRDAAEQRLEDRKQTITSQLGELYMLLDTGKITEQEFDAREQELLKQLDIIKHQLEEARGNEGR